MRCVTGGTRDIRGEGPSSDIRGGRCPGKTRICIYKCMYICIYIYISLHVYIYIIYIYICTYIYILPQRGTCSGEERAPTCIEWKPGAGVASNHARNQQLGGGLCLQTRQSVWATKPVWLSLSFPLPQMKEIYYTESLILLEESFCVVIVMR